MSEQEFEQEFDCPGCGCRVETAVDPDGTAHYCCLTEARVAALQRGIAAVERPLRSYANSLKREGRYEGPLFDLADRLSALAGEGTAS